MLDPKSKAKMEALQELKSAMSKLMQDDLKTGMGKMQKVTVAAPDKEGLKAGLDKAEDVLEEMPDDSKEGMPEMGEEEKEELPEDESSIDAMIAKLEAKKASLKK